MSATLRRLADNGAVDAVVTMSATADFCERALAPLPSQAGATQQVIADKLGWSRSIVADYAALRKIAPDGWNIVATFSPAPCRGARTTRQALSRPRHARRRAWHEQGVAALPVADITDPWLRQAITNEANRRWGRRNGENHHGR